MTNTNCGYAVCRLIGNLINGKNNTDKSELPSLSDMADFAKKHNLLTMLYPALIHCGYRKSLSNTGNLIYALLHLYKHISISGAGARMFLDIYLIQKKADAYNSELSAIIKRLGLQKFYACVSNIAGFLFEGAELDEDLKMQLNLFSAPEHSAVRLFITGSAFQELREVTEEKYSGIFQMNSAFQKKT